MRSSVRAACLALSIIVASAARAAGPVTLGEDVLAKQDFAPLREKRVGVITNHTGRNAAGEHVIDVLRANHINVVKLFSPEHGLYGTKDEKVGDGVDEKTKLPVFSLYGKTRKPTPEMLEGVDVLVYDIQDVGTRFYTYISTLGLCMEAAAASDVAFVVLDRPNPIGGQRVDGLLADDAHLGFTAYTNLPLVHGMTVGELAAYYNAEKQIGARLTVVPMEGWTRDMYWEATGVTWRNPSPNLRSPEQAVLYPAIGLIEATNISVGRGTDAPFEQIGADYIDGEKFCAALRALNLPAVEFEPTSFTPDNSFHAMHGKACQGVRIKVTDRAAFRPAVTGLSIAWTLRKLYPNEWKHEKLVNLAQNADVVARLWTIEDPKQIDAAWAGPLAQWEATRAKYLKY